MEKLNLEDDIQKESHSCSCFHDSSDCTESDHACKKESNSGSKDHVSE